MGARTRKQLEDAIVTRSGALDKPLSPADVAPAEAFLPRDALAGTRYPAEPMKHLDSER